jgi:hypothetical protein
MSVVDSAQIVAGIVAGAAIFSWLRQRYRRTLGSRRALARQLGNLGCGVRDEYVRQLLGAPTFVRTHGANLEHVYVTKHALIQTISTPDSSVIRWTVTTTDKRFRPVFRLPPMDSSGERWAVHLGGTFAGLPGQPETVVWDVGARRFSYAEQYWFGNPGGYQGYVAAHNDAGTGGAGVFHLHAIGVLSARIPDGTNEEYSLDELLARREFRAFRRDTTINTFGVSGPLGRNDEDGPQWTGPDLDHVRVLGYVAVKAPIMRLTDHIWERGREIRERRQQALLTKKYQRRADQTPGAAPTSAD